MSSSTRVGKGPNRGTRIAYPHRHRPAEAPSPDSRRGKWEPAASPTLDPNRFESAHDVINSAPSRDDESPAVILSGCKMPTGFLSRLRSMNSYKPTQSLKKCCSSRSISFVSAIPRCMSDRRALWVYLGPLLSWISTPLAHLLSSAISYKYAGAGGPEGGPAS